MAKIKDAFPRTPRSAILCGALAALAALALASSAQAAAPTVTIAAVSGAARQYTTAEVSGEVLPEGKATAWRFEYLSEAAYQENLSHSEPGFEGALEGPSGSASSTQKVKGELLGLDPETKYRLRLLATNADGEAEALAPVFETRPPAKPSIDSVGLTGVAYTEATPTARINPRGAATTYRVLYLDQADYEAEGFSSPNTLSTPPQTLSGPANPDDEAAAKLTGLAPAATYYFQALAENAKGAAAGPVQLLHTYQLPPEGPQGCPNEALRTEQHSTFLPDCRAYELVSPAFDGKNGNDIYSDPSRVQAAATETPELPMAATFPSLGAFGDAVGTGIQTEYLAQRDAAPGTSGWETHAITPPQQPLSYHEAAQGPTDPAYLGELSPELTAGVFRSPTPLSAEPNAATAGANLYTRTDLRSPGAGSYSLLTGCPACAAPLPPIEQPIREAPILGGASADSGRAIYSSHYDLSPEASGQNPKLYLGGGAQPRLLAASPACAGLSVAGSPAPAAAPCSGAGTDLQGYSYVERAISADGSRVDFESPVLETGAISERPGAAAKLYQLDDRGTASTADDALIQLSASERAAPGPDAAAEYQTAAADGSRVFFTTDRQLTEEPCGAKCLYLWARQPTDEVQRLAVDAAAGSFTLTARSQPSAGAATLTAGSELLEEVSGSFTVGQTIEGPGIPAGATVTAYGGDFSNASSSKLLISAPATASGAGVALSASIQDTTPPLPFDAAAAEVQAALEALEANGHRLYGEGNVQVSGGPGSPGASTPYTIEFTGALAGVHVMPIAADGSGLGGGAASATVTVTVPVDNLSLIGAGVGGVAGAAEDGSSVYFFSARELLPGIPSHTNHLYYWSDAGGSAALSYVGGFENGVNVSSNIRNSNWVVNPSTTRITPDGKWLLFESSEGAGLGSSYRNGSCSNDHGAPNEQGIATGSCSELYLYDAEASTPTEPVVLCPSCPTSGEVADEDKVALNYLAREGIGAAPLSSHLNRAISADGRYVFFSTRAPLSPADTNGAYDAYEYDTRTREAHLLSSGTDPYNSFYEESSADGSDAFVLTRRRLNGWDTDGSADLYDVRVAGGFPEPPAPPHAPCNGEGSCREATPPSPPYTSPGSSTQASPGNPPPRCPKGTRPLKGRKGALRCARPHRRRHKHHRRHHRRHKKTPARNGRRAAR